ncbi:hypothetical protein JG687_00001621 [Phytophthora cactorum]|uniref:Uncharacterized protein n=2 Tax=Phytophthora TaxID=4783 RepID=A0A8J5J2N2_9STRA|nr:hypothetical protein GQ600_18017 [Phytophthora cactorum]KAG6972141.1 hypothetical protein JG687_00001621 [Phytophthora cactorum]KAG6975983.1 hypothetical protein JG688_00001820 [Phytophthora aleatoria]
MATPGRALLLLTPRDGAAHKGGRYLSRRGGGGVGGDAKPESILAQIAGQLHACQCKRVWPSRCLSIGFAPGETLAQLPKDRGLHPTVLHQRRVFRGKCWKRGERCLPQSVNTIARVFAPSCWMQHCWPRVTDLDTAMQQTQNDEAASLKRHHVRLRPPKSPPKPIMRVAWHKAGQLQAKEPKPVFHHVPCHIQVSAPFRPKSSFCASSCAKLSIARRCYQ